MKPSIPSLATEALKWLERKPGNRQSPATDQPILTSIRPGIRWIEDLFREAHGGMLPDDWRYELIQDALYSISECSDDADESDILDRVREDADGRYPYTSTLTDWLGSHSSRSGYVDEAVEELGLEGGIINSIAVGIMAETEEIAGILLRCFQEAAEEADLEDEAEEAEDEEAAESTGEEAGQ